MAINLCMNLLIHQLLLSICQVGEFALFLEYSLKYQGITPRQARGGIESLSIIRMCIRLGIERSGEGARL